MPSKPRRFSRDVKLAVVHRMLAGESVAALSRELKILRKDLYKWRAVFLSVGTEAFRGPGRPRQAADAASAHAPASQAALSKAHRRIAELERKVDQQQTELDFFRLALRQLREERRPEDEPGARSSTPRSRR
jgi:transposase-like protein